MAARCESAGDVAGLIAPADSDERWFVYLFALTDCSAFKVGFTCNPLQRICTFSRRYFERFDLARSSLRPLDECEQARELETTIKAELAAFRVEAPAWVPWQAGGGTEWFSAIYLEQASARCSRFPSQGAVDLLDAFDYFRAALERAAPSFELWAAQQAHQICAIGDFARRGYVVHDARLSLRDWLDAYRYFDVPLFTEDAPTRLFVQQVARGSAS